MANTNIANDGESTRFSANRQPDKYRQPNTISGFLKEEIESDGYMIVEDAEVFDPITKKPTGEKVCVRIKLVTGKAVARRLLAVANKGNVVAIKEVMDRTEGKVPDKTQFSNAPGESLKFENASLEDLMELKAMVKKVTATQDGP